MRALSIGVGMKEITQYRRAFNFEAFQNRDPFSREVRLQDTGVITGANAFHPMHFFRGGGAIFGAQSSTKKSQAGGQWMTGSEIGG